jgi:hypothetical protein
MRGESAGRLEYINLPYSTFSSRLRFDISRMIILIERLSSESLFGRATDEQMTGPVKPRIGFH